MIRTLKQLEDRAARNFGGVDLLLILERMRAFAKNKPAPRKCGPLFYAAHSATIDFLESSAMAIGKAPTK